MSAERRAPGAELAGRQGGSRGWRPSAASRSTQQPAPGASSAPGTRHSALGTRTAAVALGANLGNRTGTIRAAIGRIGGLGRVAAVSPLFETPAWPDPSAPPYLNAALVLETTLEPTALLRALLAIERDLGRERSVANAPRTIDLDLLLVDDLVVSSPELVLPHPRLHERAFVLVPLAAVAPEMVHPLLGRTVAALLGELDPAGVAAVHRVDGGDGMP